MKSHHLFYLTFVFFTFISLISCDVDFLDWDDVDWGDYNYECKNDKPTTNGFVKAKLYMISLRNYGPYQGANVSVNVDSWVPCSGARKYYKGYSDKSGEFSTEYAKMVMLDDPVVEAFFKAECYLKDDTIKMVKQVLFDRDDYVLGDTIIIEHIFYVDE